MIRCSNAQPLQGSSRMALLNASSAPITRFTGEVAGEAEEVTAPGGDDCDLILPKGNGPGRL